MGRQPKRPIPRRRKMSKKWPTKKKGPRKPPKVVWPPCRYCGIVHPDYDTPQCNDYAPLKPGRKPTGVPAAVKPRHGAKGRGVDKPAPGAGSGLEGASNAISRRPKTPRPKLPARMWYALALHPDFSDSKVRMTVLKGRKDYGLERKVGPVIIPRHQVQEWKAEACHCERRDAIERVKAEREAYQPDEDGYIPQKLWKLRPKRRAKIDVECTCPKVPTLVWRKKFPGYLIVSAVMVDEVKAYLMKCKGVMAILMNPESIVALETEEAVHVLLERTAMNEKKKAKKTEAAKIVTKFEPGNRVRVDQPDSPWDGQEGNVKETKDGVVQVTILFMGLPVEKPFDPRVLVPIPKEVE